MIIRCIKKILDAEGDAVRRATLVRRPWRRLALLAFSSLALAIGSGATDAHAQVIIGGRIVGFGLAGAKINDAGMVVAKRGLNTLLVDAAGFTPNPFEITMPFARFQYELHISRDGKVVTTGLVNITPWTAVWRFPDPVGVLLWPAGTQEGYVAGISDGNVIAMAAAPANTPGFKPYLVGPDGRSTQLPCPQRSSCTPEAISSNGAVIAGLVDWEPAIWDTPTSMPRLLPRYPTAGQVWVNGVNDAGWVIGETLATDKPQEVALLWRPGESKVYYLENYVFTAINDNNVIVGCSEMDAKYDTRSARAIRANANGTWEQFALHYLENESSSCASDVNNNGIAVGWSDNATVVFNPLPPPQ